MHDTDVVVIGAGAVGLACAAAFARRGDDVFVLEAADGIGTGVSSRNSEVIHGGMYYPTGSLRHRFCVEGRRRLYQYMNERGVTHRKFGKLIVATSDAETKKIEMIYKTVLADGRLDYHVSIEQRTVVRRRRAGADQNCHSDRSNFYGHRSDRNPDAKPASVQAGR